MNISQLRVLVVCSANNGISSFIQEQVDSLKDKGVECDYFKVNGKGVSGYLKNLRPLRARIKEGDYNLVHAHYGLSGLLANLQRMVPVITTFHGSDVHYLFNRFLSYITSRLSIFNILTNIKQVSLLKLKKNYAIIPCGIDTEFFRPMDKEACRKKLGFRPDEQLLLFSSSFDRQVKNAKLAKKAVSRFEDVSLIELKGYSREEVVMIINASDAVLITSFYETGPLIAKEALACNTPIISTDVGDVKELIKNRENCHLIDYDPDNVTEKIKLVLDGGENHDDHHLIEGLALQDVADKIKEVYSQLLSV